jgi:hypothetical protein
MTSLVRRLQRLERDVGAGDCARCSGVFVVFMNSKFHRASRNGVSISEEQYRQYASEQGPNGQCPACLCVPQPPIKLGGLERTEARGRYLKGLSGP